MFNSSYYSLVICRNQFAKCPKKWLVIKETGKRGWWCVGGSVNKGETFLQAAHRETQEEAGISINISGVLKIDQSVKNGRNSMRVIFYGEPFSLEESLRLKSKSDSESEMADWVSLYDLHKLNFEKELRYEEPLDWA